MQTLIHRRCQYHPSREAVARCPECQRFFCRECITEHNDQVLCTSCLQRLVGRSDTDSRNGLRSVFKLLQLCCGVLVIWMCFYYFGQLLISIPTSFHEGTLWNIENRRDR